MIVATTDTSAVTNEWAMTEVIKHRVLRRIQEELDSVVGPNRMVSESDLPHLNYLCCMIWDDVEDFRLERHWLANGSRVEISQGADFKILPFSAGKRKCPGAPLGVTLVLMALARLFHCFDWAPLKGLKPEDIDTSEVYGMTMPKVEPLMALARPRLPDYMYL
uniref:Cytochrome P450 n=1 Tax=Fagus sylvatica TaxID=28930 RepID=A0A2N9GP25_FAGSY